MESLFEFAKDNLFPHGPFFAWLFLAMLFGQVMKKTLWTKHNAAHKKPHWIWWWAYKSMALHPVLVGVIIGLLWQNPEGADPAWSLAASCGYFAVAGGLSTWAYEVLKSIAKKRANLDLTLPGLDSKPPKPPEG
ncbi:MAG: hypothetical protein DRH30_04835 [Deltaproteobacteria bacterium]|nr:MAG: hypothetical protein DRH30_04835 [Deltaproteobacteria bacterium]